MRSALFGKIFICGIYLLAFLLPLAPRVLPLIIALTALAWVLEGGLNAKLSHLVRTPVLLLPMAFYLIYLTGLLYTSNFDYGLKDLETKLSLFLFPLLLSSPAFADRIPLKQLMRVFAAGCLAAAITCLVAASINFGYELYCREKRIILDAYPYTNYFFSSYLSAFLHPGYFSMYINLSVAFLLLTVSEGDYSRREVTSLAFLVLFNFLLLSKIGTIVMSLILMISLLNFSLKQINRRRAFAIGICVMGIFMSVVAYFPKVTDNFRTMLYSFSKKNLDPAATDGTEARRIAWHTAAGLVKENWLTGVGTGDIKDTMMAEYKRTGFINAYNNELNAHNQYMQTMLSVGIAGLALLAISLLVPLYAAVRKGFLLYAFFLLILAADFMVESTLETQAGVVFYAFFSSLFCVAFLQQNKSSPAQSAMSG